MYILILDAVGGAFISIAFLQEKLIIPKALNGYITLSHQFLSQEFIFRNIYLFTLLLLIIEKI